MTSADRIAFEYILENQIEALNNGQIDFLVYHPGTGGEFFSYLLNRYSSHYGIDIGGSINQFNRFMITTRFFCEAFNSDYGLYKNPDQTVDLNYLLHINDTWPSQNNMFNKEFVKFKDKYLELDNHLSNGGRVIIRSHFLVPNYMKSDNTYFMNLDTNFWKKYRYELIKSKMPQAGHSYWDKVWFNPSDLSFAKQIQMSRFFNKEYLEQMFDVQDDNFHNNIMAWHHRNKIRIEESKKDPSFLDIKDLECYRPFEE